MTAVENAYISAFCDALAKYSLASRLLADGDAWPSGSGEYLHVVIVFSGCADGVVTLTAPRHLCETFAAGASCVQAAGKEGADALVELAGAVCSELARRLFSVLPSSFQTLPPVVYRIDAGKWRELSSDCLVKIKAYLGNEPLLATLMVDPNAIQRVSVR